MDTRLSWVKTVPETNTSFVTVNPKSLLTPDLLLHFDPSTGLRDSSIRNHLITPAGDATIDTAQSVFGGASLNVGGTLLGSLAVDNTDQSLALHDGDFTVDFWIQFMPTSIGVNTHIVSENDTGAFFVIAKTVTDNLSYVVSPSGSGTGSTTVVTAGPWYHIAVTRCAHLVRFFLNGTQEGITFIEGVTVSVDNGGLGFNFSGTNFVIGDGGSGFDSHAWIDEFRVIKGYAAWTANFTPPTAPYTTIG